jgi:hypothetical protein
MSGARGIVQLALYIIMSKQVAPQCFVSNCNNKIQSIIKMIMENATGPIYLMRT